MVEKAQNSEAVINPIYHLCVQFADFAIIFLFYIKVWHTALLIIFIFI